MTILCLGDSNTYGYDPQSYFGDRYPADVRWTERMGDWKTINCGMNGLPVPYDAAPFVDLVRSKEPDLVVVMLGSNDLLEGANASAVAMRMEAFLTAVQQACPNVLLVAPPPMQPGVWVQNRELMNPLHWEKRIVIWQSGWAYPLSMPANGRSSWHMTESTLPRRAIGLLQKACLKC